MSKVALMCGHGRSTDGTWDCGTSYGGNNEAALMLPITKAAVKYLRSYGVTVISDADTNNNKNMIADVSWANKENKTTSGGVVAYISLHCDYFKSPSGTLPLFVSAKGKELATKINNAVLSGMGMKTRGVTRRTDLYELNYTDMPACIFETGSIKADISKLKNDPDKYGKCIAKGICDYLGVKAEASTVSAPTTPTVSDGKLSVDGKGGKKTVKRLQEFLGCSTKDGIISGQNKSLAKYYPNLTSVEFGGGGSPTVKNLQKWVGANEDGIIGQITVKLLQKKLGVTQDGIAGANTIKALQTWLNTHDKADYPAPKTTTPAKTTTPTLVDKELAACKTQSDWMKNAKYEWESKPTIEKSKKKGTCVTYVACVLQRLGILNSGQALWHNGKGYGTGKVTGANSKMDVKYMDNKTLKSLKSQLKAGDIILLDDNKSGVSGSGGHIFILNGKWTDAGNPYIWDNYTSTKGQKAREYSGSRKVLARVRLIESTPTYRVRKTWADSKSQVGAYKILENAKKECDKHAGYSVYDESGKAVYTSKAAAVKTNAQKLAEKANSFAYATNTSKAKYPSGSPTAAYKTGLNQAYPNRSSWGKAPKAGASCDVFVGTCVRCAGIDPNFPRGLSPSYLAKSTKFKLVKVTAKTIQNGDIIVSSKHICIAYGGKIKEASNGDFYPKTTDTLSKRLSASGAKVYRAK